MDGLIFFFQAEDGIRDLVRSRGLGDVYKRQVYPFRQPAWVGPVHALPGVRVPAALFLLPGGDELSLIHI